MVGVLPCHWMLFIVISIKIVCCTLEIDLFWERRGSDWEIYLPKWLKMYLTLRLVERTQLNCFFVLKYPGNFQFFPMCPGIALEVWTMMSWKIEKMFVRAIRKILPWPLCIALPMVGHYSIIITLKQVVYAQYFLIYVTSALSPEEEKYAQNVWNFLKMISSIDSSRKSKIRM